MNSYDENHQRKDYLHPTTPTRHRGREYVNWRRTLFPQRLSEPYLELTSFRQGGHSNGSNTLPITELGKLGNLSTEKESWLFSFYVSNGSNFKKDFLNNPSRLSIKDLNT